MADIVHWAESKLGFWVDRRWQDGRWILERGPIRLAEYHRDILRHCFTPDESGRLPYDALGWCEPAKSGKSAIAGLVAEYAGLHLDGDVILASNKQNQAASIMFKSLTDSISYNPHIRVDPHRYEVEFRNGNTARAIASNSRTEAGARFSLALFDELWGYQYQDAERLWSEFKTDPTRLTSLKMALGYAGYLESKLWLEVLNTGLAGEPVPELAHIRNPNGQPACWRNGRHFVFWSHQCRQPWQTSDWIESQRKSLRPAEFQRMIECVFVEGEGDFLPPGVWESLIDPNHKPLPPGSRHPVWLGLDLALAAGGDDAALVGVYRDQGKIKLAFHQIWRGGKSRRQQLKLRDTVLPACRALAQAYEIVCLVFDPWQGAAIAEELTNADVQCWPMVQSHATRAPSDTLLWRLAMDHELVLYPDEELISAAASASAKELGDGKLFITKSGRGKIDTLIALSMAVSQAAVVGVFVY